MTDRKEGYRRLVFAVLAEGLNGEDMLPIRECDMDSIDKVVASLKEPKADIIKMRFGLSGKAVHTLNEIGHIFDVTAECIRQQEAKALKILSSPSRCKVFKRLFRSEFESMLQKSDMLVKEMERKIGRIQDEFKKELMQERLGSTKSSLGIKSLDEISIDKLDFAVRVHTCLKRVKITTLPELLGKTEAELLTIVGFGRKSMFELKTCLNRMGLELAKEKSKR